jgi:hypothetical protein
MWTRQIHRWMSILLVASIFAYPFVMKIKGLPHWVVYGPALPLIVLLVTGLYLFVQPHARKWRRESISVSPERRQARPA